MAEADAQSLQNRAATERRLGWFLARVVLSMHAHQCSPSINLIDAQKLYIHMQNRHLQWSGCKKRMVNLPKAIHVREHRAQETQGAVGG